MTNRWMIAMAAGASINIEVPAERDVRAGAARGRQGWQQRAAERDQQRYAREAAGQRDARQAGAQRNARATNQRQDERDRYDARRIGRSAAPC